MTHDADPRQPEFDADGYLTEATLSAIEHWPCSTVDDCEALIAFLCKAWHWHDYATRDGEYLYLVTGGWSGNEDIMAALEKSTFWIMFWQESKRGGSFTFRLNLFPYTKPEEPDAARR